MTNFPTLHERMVDLFPAEWITFGQNWERVATNHVAGVPLECDPAYGKQLLWDGEAVWLYKHGGLMYRVANDFEFLTEDRQSDMWMRGKPTQMFWPYLLNNLPAPIKDITTLNEALRGQTERDGLYYFEGGRTAKFSFHDALMAGFLDKCPLRELKCKKVILIAWNDKGNTFENSAFQMWSDGSVTHLNIYEYRDRPETHQPDNVKLSKIPLELRDMLVYTKWEAVAPQERIALVNNVLDSHGQVTITSIKNTKSKKIGFTSHGSADTEIKKVQAHGFEFYIVETNWGEMGEDGDAGREVIIAKTLKDANNAYKEMRKIWH